MRSIHVYCSHVTVNRHTLHSPQQYYSMSPIRRHSPRAERRAAALNEHEAPPSLDLNRSPVVAGTSYVPL